MQLTAGEIAVQLTCWGTSKTETRGRLRGLHRSSYGYPASIVKRLKGAFSQSAYVGAPCDR